MELKSRLEQLGIHTRLVPCELELAFSRLDSTTPQNLEGFEREFRALARERGGSAQEWLNRNKSKNRLEDTDEVLLELLLELYRKVEHIEQILQDKTRRFEKLDSESVAHFVGHGVLCLDKPRLEVGSAYYVRVFLPLFPPRYVGVFARAVDRDIFHLERVHESDSSDFDSYVVECERAMIRDSKSLSKE